MEGFDKQLDGLRKERHSLFSHMLTEKRRAAGLTLAELAELTRLPLLLLENLEASGQPTPSFDVCYKIAQALNSRHKCGFVIHDLWQAATMNRQKQSPHQLPARRAEPACRGEKEAEAVLRVA